MHMATLQTATTDNSLIDAAVQQTNLSMTDLFYLGL